ncbi:uncharacterized protein TRIADDRAFT_51798 [Trichoplax adhaerens]|uniref:G-protein coupled receptors family 1 profile domain-containing protein n=1 Tax=Trichoplax adhaerens TaxID=10228 RepID=B3RKX3_TRIAD|nr:hypothetical protein TRIADDRAFT_51798 [Trichoplax adhaerens]EDV29449.1 hypothetical protein TRIADDRAFT_51798 [Trichoplax adhaerens]|eukprot:XP_002108651.1 hypothetical protein TRIADDRAFT_51798 [Trichoplax adhaerens]
MTHFVLLRHIRDISHNNISDVQVDAFQGLEILEELDISYNSLDIAGDLQSNHIRLPPLSTLKNLNLAGNQILLLEADVFSKEISLERLNLSRNNLLSSNVKEFIQPLKELKSFYLDHNKITAINKDTRSGYAKARILYMGNNFMSDVCGKTFTGFFYLETLYLSDNNIRKLDANCFSILSNLKELHLERNLLVEFNQDIFNGLTSLYTLHSTREFLCCVAPTTVLDCSPINNQEQLSTCNDVLAHVSLRIFVWCTSCMIIIGNILTLYVNKTLEQCRNPVPKLLVNNLASADLLMGIYLLIIGFADGILHNRYASNLEYWLQSPMCALACFLTAISSVMSVVIMLIITVDRFINIVFVMPKFKITKKCATITMITSWSLCIVCVGIPAIASINQQSDNRFYEYSSVCMPSNINNPYFANWIFVVLGMSFLIWIAILIMYGLTLASLRKARLKVKKKSDFNYEKRVAIRMLVILTTDLATWMPFYVLLISGVFGNEIDIHALPFIAILVMPMNSCINPFLYTLSTKKVLQHFRFKFSTKTDTNEYSQSNRYRSSKPLPEFQVDRELDTAGAKVQPEHSQRVDVAVTFSRTSIAPPLGPSDSEILTGNNSVSNRLNKVGIKKSGSDKKKKSTQLSPSSNILFSLS